MAASLKQDATEASGGLCTVRCHHAERNSVTPPAERPPPQSTPRPVGGASGPPGTAEDTWGSVAREHNIDVQELIRFNFGTNDSKRVNWYLKRNVGCNVASPSGLNWTFKDAMPGIIFLPIQPSAPPPRRRVV